MSQFHNRLQDSFEIAFKYNFVAPLKIQAHNLNPIRT